MTIKVRVQKKKTTKPSYKREIKTSSDFENNPQGALDALEKTGFAVIMITKSWYKDKRAQKEWRFLKDMKKPMVYIVSESGRDKFTTEMLFTENLIGIIHDYGDTEKTSNYLQAILTAFEHNLDE